MIIDEEKSVKWNREELYRQRAAFEARVEDLNKYKNLIDVHFKEQLNRLLAKDNHITIAESKKLFDFAYKTDYTKGIRTVVNTYKGLAKMYKELLEIHDSKKGNSILTPEVNAYDIDRVVEALKENSSNFQKSYKIGNLKHHKTYKAIKLNKAIEIVEMQNRN